MRLLLAVFLSVCYGLAGEVKLGKPLSLKQPIEIGKLLSEPGRYVGKRVQVKGAIREVCQHMGCWMEIGEPGSTQGIRIKVNDGEIVFPRDAAGKTAIAEGKLVKLELSKEQAIAMAKHEAEENNKKFDPSTIKSGMTIYQIQGAGAVILE